MTIKTVTALYDRYENARDTIADLEAAKISTDNISVIANNSSDRLVAARTAPGTEAGAGAGAGASFGVVLGGGAGLFGRPRDCWPFQASALLSRPGGWSPRRSVPQPVPALAALREASSAP